MRIPNISDCVKFWRITSYHRIKTTQKLISGGHKIMMAIVRNGCCEIRGRADNVLVVLPPMNIEAAILHGEHVAVVLKNGYCQLYTADGKLVTMFSVSDAKYTKFVGKDQLAIHRRNGRVEVRDFSGRLVRVHA